MLTHEDFKELAEAKATVAQGLRPLAAHVRELYGAIRTLQEEDNAFAYIAETIRAAREDKTDADQFMHRIKSYYHRDRKAAGDAKIVRGRTRRPKNTTAPPPDKDTEGPAPPSPTSPNGVLPAGLAGEHVVSQEESIPTKADVAGEGAPIPKVSKAAQQASRSEGGALTAAVHMRRGRRRLVSGG